MLLVRVSELARAHDHELGCQSWPGPMSVLAMARAHVCAGTYIGHIRIIMQRIIMQHAQTILQLESSPSYS